MISRNARRYWELMPHELPLHHFPGRPELRTEPASELPWRHYPHTYVQRFDTWTRRRDLDRRINLIKRCYWLFGLCVCCSIFEWVMVAELVPEFRQFILPGFICLLIALVMLFLLTFCLRLRANHWFGCAFYWTLTLTVATSVIFLIPERSSVKILVTTLPALACIVVCYVMGAYLPRTVLPGMLTVAVSIILFSVAGSIVLILLIVTTQTIYKTVYFGVIFLSTIPLSLFHAQFLHGRGFTVAHDEYLNCSIIIYLQFAIFFLSLYHFSWGNIGN